MEVTARHAALFLVIASPFVGSFLATLAYRLPRGLPVVAARSSCPSCGARLGAVDLVPIVGWLVRRARCAACGQPIAADYPLIEIGALGIAAWAVLAAGAPAAWALAVLGWGLLALAAIDARHFYLPDLITAPLGVLGLALAWGDVGLPHPVTAADAVIGAVLGFTVFALTASLYRRLRGRAGLGLGDAKLLAAAGAWVGWQGLASVVLIGALSALAVAAILAVRARRLPEPGQKLPFGPYLALGLWLGVLYGPISFRLF